MGPLILSMNLCFLHIKDVSLSIFFFKDLSFIYLFHKMNEEKTQVSLTKSHMVEIYIKMNTAL